MTPPYKLICVDCGGRLSCYEDGVNILVMKCKCEELLA